MNDVTPNLIIYDLENNKTYTNEEEVDNSIKPKQNKKILSRNVNRRRPRNTR